MFGAGIQNRDKSTQAGRRARAICTQTLTHAVEHSLSLLPNRVVRGHATHAHFLELRHGHRRDPRGTRGNLFAFLREPASRPAAPPHLRYFKIKFRQIKSAIFSRVPRPLLMIYILHNHGKLRTILPIILKKTVATWSMSASILDSP